MPKSCLWMLVILPALLAGSLRAQTASQPPYLNTALPFEQRVDDLVGRMTLEEKASQLVNQAPRHPAPQRSRLRLVERSPARRRQLRHRYRFPRAHRPRLQLRSAAHS